MKNLIYLILMMGSVIGCTIFSTSDSRVNIDIQGKVYDKNTGSPIAGALVEVYMDDWFSRGTNVLERTFSSPGMVGPNGSAGFYHIETGVVTHINCDSTVIYLTAHYKVIYVEGDSTISYRMPNGPIQLTCNKDSKNIEKTINLGLEKY